MPAGPTGPGAVFPPRRQAEEACSACRPTKVPHPCGGYRGSLPHVRGGRPDRGSQDVAATARGNHPEPGGRVVVSGSRSGLGESASVGRLTAVRVVGPTGVRLRSSRPGGPCVGSGGRRWVRSSGLALARTGFNLSKGYDSRSGQGVNKDSPGTALSLPNADTRSGDNTLREIGVKTTRGSSEFFAAVGPRNHRRGGAEEVERTRVTGSGSVGAHRLEQKRKNLHLCRVSRFWEPAVEMETSCSVFGSRYSPARENGDGLASPEQILKWSPKR
jgi:hypothetical protein